VSELVLKNGAKGLIIYVPSAEVMTFELNFRAGEYLVEEKKWEVPHLMEHVLLGANKKFQRARDFSAELEKNGAYSNASTSVYDITYEAECADFEWDRILNLLITAITEPLFLQDEFAAEFGNVQEELAARSNNHFRNLSLALREKYGFLAKTDQERLKLMKNVKVSDIRDHYEITHTSGNMRFVIAGNITPGRVSQIEETLSKVELPRGKRFALPDEKPLLLEKPLYLHNASVKNVYFYMDTFLKRRLEDPESDALNLINTALTETLHSNILGKAREHGLVYHMSSGINEAKLCSGWWFGAQVSKKSALPLADIIVEELEKIFHGDLPAADIDSAKQYALGRFQRGAQTVGGTASGYSERYFFDSHIEDYYQIPKRIRDITKTRIVDVTREMFSNDIWGIGTLGNSGEEFAEELQARLALLWRK
jgi:predicted Zn-dependent peptidase